MTYTGEWRDDSIEVWQIRAEVDQQDVASLASYACETQVVGDGSVPWSQAVVNAWAGVGTPSSHNNSVNYLFAQSATGFGANSQATWEHGWATIRRTGTFTQGEGILPPGTMDDPNVVGVEWEPTSTAVGQRLVVNVALVNGNPVAATGEPLFVKLGTYNPTGTYAPGFEAASAVAGRTTLATIPGPGTQAIITDLPGPPNADFGIAVGLLDYFTQAQTPLPYNPDKTSQRRATFSLRLESSYRPRYRLIYAVPPAPTSGRIPPIRHVQRGDGLGLSTAPRMSQLSSIQGSLRNSSYL